MRVWWVIFVPFSEKVTCNLVYEERRSLNLEENLAQNFGSKKILFYRHSVLLAFFWSPPYVNEVFIQPKAHKYLTNAAAPACRMRHLAQWLTLRMKEMENVLLQKKTTTNLAVPHSALISGFLLQDWISGRKFHQERVKVRADF